MESSQLRSVGDWLRYWRSQRGLSQLDLALEGGISQRHLSFIESGRSVPSRAMLTLLSDTLSIPLREHNTLMLAAGYAPSYAETTLDDTTMKMVSHALDRMLHQHEPHPALVMDRYWNILRSNAAAQKLVGSMISFNKFPKPRNLLELIFDPNGLRPFIENWETVAAGLLQRVRREAPGGHVDDRLYLLLDKVKCFPGADKLSVLPTVNSPVLPITFLQGEERSSYFSLVTTIGTPQTVTAQELRLECMFPM